MEQESAIGHEQVGNAYRAFLVYTQLKRRECFKDFTEGQRDAFLLIPHLLHTAEPKQLGFVEGRPALCGIHGYKYAEEIKAIGKRHFSAWERFEEPKQVLGAPIESLAIMGSAGSIAQTEGSDLDYWVTIRPGIVVSERQRLQAKLTAIEKWCWETLKAEVHFFVSTSDAVRKNDFGSVNKESCGTALGKLLKEEFYRSSLHVMGKIPLWWVAPHNAPDAVYAQLPKFLGPQSGAPREDFIDFGNIAEIPADEFVGGGMWQLNKGIGSPFKSALKMALLLEYADTTQRRDLLAQALKRRMLDNATDIDQLDPYRMMVERVIAFHAGRGEAAKARLLQRCLFLKMHTPVSRWWDSPRASPQRATRALLELVKSWGWTVKDAEKWEHFDELPMRELVEFKHELENYMFTSLQALRTAGVAGEARAVNAVDFRKMTQRLATVFNPTRERVEWFYPPYLTLIQSDCYSIQEEEQDGAWVWNLYAGVIDEEGGASGLSAKKRIRTAPDLANMATWMFYNHLVRSQTRLLISHKSGIPFTGNLRRLGETYQEHIGQPELPTLDSDAFEREPFPVRWLVVVNLVPFMAHREAEAVTEKEDDGGGGETLGDLGEAVPIGAVHEADEAVQERDAGLIASELAEALDDAGFATKAAEIKEVAEGEEPPPADEVLVGGRSLPLVAGRVPMHEDHFNVGPAAVSAYRDAFLIEQDSWGEVFAHPLPVGRAAAHAIRTIVEHGMRLGRKEQEVLYEVCLGPYHPGTARQRFTDLVGGLSKELLLSPRPSAVALFQEDGAFIAVVRRRLQTEVMAFETFPEAVHHANLRVEGEADFVFDPLVPRLAVHHNIYRQSRRGENMLHLMEVESGIMVSCVDQNGRYVFDALDLADFKEQWPPLLLSFLGAWRQWIPAGKQGKLRILRQKAGEPEGKEITDNVLGMFKDMKTRLPRTQMTVDSGQALAWLRRTKGTRDDPSPVEDELRKSIALHEQAETRPFILSSIRIENRATTCVWSPSLQLQLRQCLIRKGRRLQSERKRTSGA